MKKILLFMFLLIPFNVLAMDQVKLHLYVDISAIPSFSDPITINYIEDINKEDPPLEQIVLSKDNNYELNLIKGEDFTDFNYDSTEIVNGKSYEIEEEHYVADGVLNYKFMLKKEIEKTTVPTTSKVISAEEIIIGDIPTKKTTTTTTTKKSQMDESSKETRNKIYTISFFVLFGILIIFMLIGIVKISQANK